MKLTTLLALLAVASTAQAAEPLTLNVRPIDDFIVVTPGSEEPALQFLGGLQLLSDNGDFGGLSGIDVLGDGTVFMVGDSGTFVTARFVFENERLAGLADAAMGSLFPGGGTSKEDGDAEDVAFNPADPTRGVIVRERQANAMLSFEVSEGQPINFEPRRVGADDRLLRSNRGLESVAYAPAASPIAGEVVTIAERPPRGQTDIPAWIVGMGPFSIVRHDNVGSSRVDLQACKLEYSIVSPK